MKVVVAGAGAFGKKHLEAISRIEGVECVCVVGRRLPKTRAVAQQYGICHATTSLAEALELPDVSAVILSTPTQLHAGQAIQCLEAGKHVQVEIPLADSLDDAIAVVNKQQATGLIAMCGHTRRFNLSHQWVHQRIAAGSLRIQHMVVDTHFFRRENVNANGDARSWTDHLLWHHAAHTVDLFAYLTGEPIVQVNAIAGARHPTLGIAMDMSIQMTTASAQICSLSLSFNNEGPLGSVFRYICDEGTYVASYDDLVDGYGHLVDLSSMTQTGDGVELQDREFFAAIAGSREPNASVGQVLDCYRVLGDIERQISLP